MAILDLMGAAAGGGLFGVLGTVAGRVAQYFETKQSQAHEKARWAHEIKLLAMQQDRQLAEQEHALEVLETEGRWQGLTALLEADARVGKSYLWVDAVRALTRPILTCVLWLLAAGVWLTTQDAGLRVQITQTITFAATAATLWWFGDRALVHSKDKTK